MSNDPPVDFQEQAKSAIKPGGGAPLQISASALQKNFAYATLVIDETWVEPASGKNGHNQRRIKLPTIDANGTYVLGTVDGVLQWLATEEC
jgi:hypothetical protein